MGENDTSAAEHPTGVNDDLVESTVYLKLISVEEGGPCVFTAPPGIEARRYHQWVEESNPDYRAEYESKGWPALSSDMNDRVFATTSDFDLPDLPVLWRVIIKSKPSNAWQVRSKIIHRAAKSWLTFRK